MTSSQFEREKNYQVSLVIAKNMLRVGLINENEFEKIKDYLANQYCPIIGSL